jgi:hypothetical protein
VWHDNQLFDVLGSELSFTVDLSNVPAGMNAAICESRA